MIKPIDMDALKAEMAKYYGPCQRHHLWHSLDKACFYCLTEFYDANLSRT